MLNRAEDTTGGLSILVKNRPAFYRFVRVEGRKETRTVKNEGNDPLARIEESQNALRENIKASERLLEKTQALIKQHRRTVDQPAE